MATAHDSIAPKARRPMMVRLARWFLWAIGLLVILLVAFLIWLMVRDRVANAQLQEQIGALKTAGLPYDNQSLGEYYARQVGEHAGDEGHPERWVAVLTSVPGFSQAADRIEPGGRLPPAPEPWPDEAQVREFLHDCSELRNTARQLALQDRQVRLPINLNSHPPEATLLPELRRLARLFCLEAQVAVRNRNSADARDAILAIFGCGRAIEGQPLIVSQMVGTAFESMATEQLRHALEANLFETEDLRRLLARIEKRPSLETVWTISMNGERAAMLPAFTGHPEESQQPGRAAPRVAAPLRSRDALAYVQFIDQAVAVPADDLNEFCAGMLELEESMEAKAYSSNWLTRFDTALTTSAMPMFSATKVVFVQREMLARLATLGIGVRLYEDKHGTLPDKLDQLSDIGLDVSKLTPLGDKPFGYRNEAEQAILWGFSVRHRTSTPDEPPAVLDRSDEAVTRESMEAKESGQWVWKFPK